MRKEQPVTRSTLSAVLSILFSLFVAVGCDNTGPGLFGRPGQNGDPWTIRCLTTSAEQHAVLCNQLAEMLRQVDGIKPDDVRVESNPVSSSIYYGRYLKSAAAPDGGLGFSRRMQRDITRIRGLKHRDAFPFAQAVPEPMDKAGMGTNSEWHVSKAKGTHSLLVAVFYNTPSFDQRKEVAEQYVAMLREDGYAAYFTHELVKSYVYVGDFDKSDGVVLPDGQWQYGPRVAKLIDSRPDEFRYLLENGHRRKKSEEVGGRMTFEPSLFVPLPEKGSSRRWR